MRVRGEARRTIWPSPEGSSVRIIDQTRLPHEFAILELADLEGVARAISHMQVRGAPLIGVTAAYGLALAMRQDSSNTGLERAHGMLLSTRPTAVNLSWALEKLRSRLRAWPPARPRPDTPPGRCGSWSHRSQTS